MLKKLHLSIAFMVEFVLLNAFAIFSLYIAWGYFIFDNKTEILLAINVVVFVSYLYYLEKNNALEKRKKEPYKLFNYGIEPC